jgi:hypothetical protein
LAVSDSAPIQQFAWSFPLQPEWLPAKLRAAVFVEDAATREILAATRATIVEPSAAAPTSWGRVKSAYR